jgi:hypothetical protein
MNSIQSRFKYLIEINNHKYTVIIDDNNNNNSINNNGINFSQVLTQIQEIVDKNISLKTHLFEVIIT